MAVISKAQIEDSAVAGLAQSTQLGATGAVKEPHAESKHFDVMMMDIGMPGIDGFAACRRIVELVHLVASNKYDLDEHNEVTNIITTPIGGVVIESS